MKHNFMKNWRVVKYIIKKQYDIGVVDLELLIFLYSEGRFTKDDFEWYKQIVPWDNQRFTRLMKEGWVKKWGQNYKHRRAVYELTHRGKTMVARVYRLLLEEERFPDSTATSINKKKTYTNNRYRKAIRDLNKDRSF